MKESASLQTAMGAELSKVYTAYKEFQSSSPVEAKQEVASTCPATKVVFIAKKLHSRNYTTGDYRIEKPHVQVELSDDDNVEEGFAANVDGGIDNNSGQGTEEDPEEPGEGAIDGPEKNGEPQLLFVLGRYLGRYCVKDPKNRSAAYKVLSEIIPSGLTWQREDVDRFTCPICQSVLFYKEGWVGDWCPGAKN
jgi:hypothetical protein